MKFLLILAVAPGAFLVYQVYKQDKIEKEPAPLIRKLLLAGAISVFAALILEIIVGMILGVLFTPGTYLYIAMDAFFGTALIEEAVKYIPLKKITWNNPEFDYTFDAIVYAVCVGMGFAIVENIFYVIENGMGNAVMRALTAIPGHCVFAIYMGYYYGLARKMESQGNRAGVKVLLRKALWVPVLIHGFYDFCLMSESGLLILLFFAFIIALFIITYKRLKSFSANDTAIIDETIHEDIV